MDNPERFLISVIYPLYNVENEVDAFMEHLKGWDFNCQVILVNDGSTDNTKAKVEAQLPKFSNVYYVGYQEHKGKGAAIRTGIPFCKGNMVTIQEISRPLMPQHFKSLFLPLVNGKGKVAYGSPYYGPESVNEKSQKAASRLTQVTNKLYSQNFVQEETLFKVYDVLTLKMLKLESAGEDIFSEITAKLCNKGIPILNVPSENFNGEEGLRQLSLAQRLSAISTLVKYKYIAPPSSKKVKES